MVTAGVALLSVLLAGAADIDPPPRGQWVLDQTSSVSSATIAEVNGLAEALDNAGAGQLGVLVISSTNRTSPREFATRVFNLWGVGHHGAGDGVLLFVALQDRKAEIVLSDGSKLSTGQTDAVMQDDVVANMKRGQLDAAILSAARSLVKLLHAAGGRATPRPEDNRGLGGNTYVTPMYSSPDRDDELAMFAEGSKMFPERSPRTWVVDPAGALTASQRAKLDVAASDLYADNKGRLFFLVVRLHGSYPSLRQLSDRLQAQVAGLSSAPTAVIAIDLDSEQGLITLPFAVKSSWELGELGKAQGLLGKHFERADPSFSLLEGSVFVHTALTSGIPSRPVSDVLREGYERFWVLLSILGAIGTVGGLSWFLRWFRRRPRTCEECKNPRQLLSDAAEDEHLDSRKQKEEALDSVNYDVWWCGRCKDVLVVRYDTFFSRYSPCESCGAKTVSSTTTTLEHATEYSGGLERIDETCEHCAHKRTFTRATARLDPPSSSSSSTFDSGWSSSSSSSFDSSFSSSSSSDSSFGGGSSSGGGSSGSW